eukprot:scaffold88295_cov41-Attheya_sp.AAC.1
MAAAVDSIIVNTSPSKPAKRAASSMARRPHIMPKWKGTPTTQFRQGRFKDAWASVLNARNNQAATCVGSTTNTPPSPL